MKQRPDLPQLESVEAGNSKYRPFRTIAVAIGVAFLPFLLTAIFFISIPETLKFLIQQHDFSVFALGVFALIAVDAWIIRRCIFDDFYWKTSSDGLALRNPFRTKFIRWSDIKTATVKCNGSRCTFRITTSKGNFTVASAFEYMFGASMWQHLLRVSKLDNTNMPDYLDSFWDEIPNTVPHEIIWNNPRLPRYALYHVLFYTSIALGLTLLIYTIFVNNNLSGFVFSFVPFIILVFASLRSTAGSIPVYVKLNDDIITMNICGKCCDLPWSGITVKLSAQGLLLSWPDQKINWLLPNDFAAVINDESTQVMILALIRRLRTAEPPYMVPIPSLSRNEPFLTTKGSL